MKKRTLIFGSGQGAIKFLEKYISTINIVGVLDNDIKKHGNLFEGVLISKPEDIATFEYDQIIIATQWAKSVYSQLTQELNIESSKIVIPAKVDIKRVKRPFENKEGRELARNIVKCFSTTAREHSIPLVLDFGTLLGIVRDNDIIEWDDDVDFSIASFDNTVDYESWIKYTLAKIKSPVKFEYHMKKDSKETVNYAIYLNEKECKDKNFECFYTSITFRKLIGDNYIHLPSAGMWYSPKKHFNSFELFNWQDVEVQVPYSYKEYLTFLYGDWETPKKDITMNDYANLGDTSFSDLKEIDFTYDELSKEK